MWRLSCAPSTFHHRSATVILVLLCIMCCPNAQALISPVRVCFLPGVAGCSWNGHFSAAVTVACRDSQHIPDRKAMGAAAGLAISCAAITLVDVILQHVADGELTLCEPPTSLRLLIKTCSTTGTAALHYPNVCCNRFCSPCNSQKLNTEQKLASDMAYKCT